MKLAVIGAGVSGLVAAHLLGRHHDVDVFEANAYAGGHTNTVRVDVDSQVHWVDTGFIVHNDRNYPRFEKLMAALQVPTQPSNMSFSVSDGGRFEYASTSFGGLFANKGHLANPRFLRMVADVPRFQKAARKLLAEPEAGASDISLGDWLEQGRYSRVFIDRLIVPQASAVWSADPAQMWTFPMRFLAEFFANHGMLGLKDRPQWRTIVGGSQVYVQKLLSAFGGQVHLSSPVERVERTPDAIHVTPRGGDTQAYDQVVVATHSDQALAMLAAPTDRERELLGAIPYQANEAVLHTDRSLLPKRKAAWASWNYHLLDEPPGRTVVTYHMNRLQDLTADREFCVTLNRTAAIDPEQIIRTIQYAHPVYTPAGHAAQARWREISGADRIHYCGAYWGWGFHEDGVVSGERVAQALGSGGL